MAVSHLDKYRHELMKRDILDELVFLEFLDDWKNLDRVVMKDELIELLDNFSKSFRCTPHFENWWKLLDDKDLGRKYIANRLKTMSILQGHGESRHPYVWHRRALNREISHQTQLRMDKGISKTLAIPLTYEEAFKYDVFKWTQVAMHVLRTRSVWMTTNLIGQAKNSVPRTVDPKEYATAVINEMKKDPRMTFSIDAKDRGVFSKASAFMDSVTLTVEAAVAKFTDMALLALEKVARFPVTTIWMEARRRHGFPCLRYKTKRDSLTPEEEEDQKYVDLVVEGMRRDPRLEFVDASDMTQRFFCLPPPMQSSGHASIATAVPNEGPRIVPISVPLGAEEAAVKFTKKALKYLENHPRYYISTIREATQFCLPPQWTHDHYVDYIVERLRSDDRLGFQDDHFFLVKKLNVPSAAQHLTEEILNKLKELPTVSIDYITAEAAKLQPEGILTLDEYVAGIVERIKKDKRLVYGADALGRGIFGLEKNMNLSITPFMDSNHVKKEPAVEKMQLSIEGAKHIQRALRHLENYEVYSISLLADESFGLADHAEYVQCVVEAMKEDPRLKFIPGTENDPLSGAFELAHKRLKKRKRMCGDVVEAIEWREPLQVLVPDNISRLPHDYTTPEVKAQSRRMKLIAAGRELGMEEPVKLEPTICIPLQILRFH